VFAVVVFHRIYESVELGNASFDHQSPSKLVAPVRDSIVRRSTNAVKRFCPLELLDSASTGPDLKVRPLGPIFEYRPLTQTFDSDL
jgi:hypothetical protein